MEIGVAIRRGYRRKDRHGGKKKNEKGKEPQGRRIRF